MPLRAVLRRTCGISTRRAVGFVHLLGESRPAGLVSRSVSQWRRRARGHIPAGICRADRGNSSPPGLKLRCSPDSDRWILPSAVVRFNRTADVHKQKHIRHLHVGTRNLPPEQITTLGSSVEFEQRRSALKPCQSANTWQPFGIIKTGHAPQPPLVHRTLLSPPTPNAPWQQYPLRRRFFHFSCQSHLLHHLPGMALIENALKCWCRARTGCLHAD